MGGVFEVMHRKTRNRLREVWERSAAGQADVCKACDGNGHGAGWCWRAE